MACDNYQNGSQFQVSVVGRIDAASDVINSYQMFLVSGGTTNISTVGDSLVDIFNDLYDLVKVFCNVLTVWEGIRVAELDGDCATGLLPFASPIVGSLTGDAVPPGVAALISFPTGVKRRVLRKYFGGLDEGSIGPSGLIPTTVQTQMNTVGNFLLTDQEAFGLTWRYSHNTVVNGTPAVLFPTGRVSSRNPAYQRRRRRGTGN